MYSIVVMYRGNEYTLNSLYHELYDFASKYELPCTFFTLARLHDTRVPITLLSGQLKNGKALLKTINKFNKEYDCSVYGKQALSILIEIRRKKSDAEKHDT